MSVSFRLNGPPWLSVCFLFVFGLFGSQVPGQEDDSPQKVPGDRLLKVEVANGEPKYADDAFVYKTVGDRKLKIFVTRPTDWAKADRRPAVVFFHGGGWVGGKPGQFDEHSRRLSERGMFAFQVEYRLLKKKSDPNQDTTPTVCIRDAKSAMRWVRQHAADLGIDPDRIAAGGGSAGGHLAAFLGTTDGMDDPADDASISARPNALVLFNPVYDNGPDGWGHKRVGKRFREFSPAHNISADDCPAIVFLGTADKLIPVKSAKQFQSTMQKAGLKSELRLYEGAGHGFFNFGKEDGKWYRLTVAEMEKFLQELGWIEN